MTPFCLGDPFTELGVLACDTVGFSGGVVVRAVPLSCTGASVVEGGAVKRGSTIGRFCKEA